MAQIDFERLALYDEHFEIENPECGLWECVTDFEEVQAEPDLYKQMKVVSHAGLLVLEPASPDPKSFYVNVIIAPKKKTELYVESTHTINDLLQALKLKPNVYVVYNGATVQGLKKLFELRVKPGDTLIICKICHGG